MLGRHYNHLYLVDTITDILVRKNELQAMAKRLNELNLTSAARDTSTIVDEITHFQEVIQTRLHIVRDVWKYVEWFDSGYCDLKDVQHAVNEYLRMSGNHP